MIYGFFVFDRIYYKLYEFKGNELKKFNIFKYELYYLIHDYINYEIIV